MVYTIILLVADWTLFCDFTRKQLPARKVIFVAQLGRKFRLFSLTVQRYNLFIAVYESRANIFLVFLRKRQAKLLRVAVLQFSKGFSHTLKILLYLYINIELIFDYHRIYFGTATLQQPHLVISEICCIFATEMVACCHQRLRFRLWHNRQ